MLIVTSSNQIQEL